MAQTQVPGRATKRMEGLARSGHHRGLSKGPCLPWGLGLSSGRAGWEETGRGGGGQGEKSSLPGVPRCQPGLPGLICGPHRRSGPGSAAFPARGGPVGRRSARATAGALRDLQDSASSRLAACGIGESEDAERRPRRGERRSGPRRALRQGGECHWGGSAGTPAVQRRGPGAGAAPAGRSPGTSPSPPSRLRGVDARRVARAGDRMSAAAGRCGPIPASTPLLRARESADLPAHQREHCAWSPACAVQFSVGQSPKTRAVCHQKR